MTEGQYPLCWAPLIFIFSYPWSAHQDQRPTWKDRRCCRQEVKRVHLPLMLSCFCASSSSSPFPQLFLCFSPMCPQHLHSPPPLFCGEEGGKAAVLCCRCSFVCFQPSSTSTKSNTVQTLSERRRGERESVCVGVRSRECVCVSERAHTTTLSVAIHKRAVSAKAQDERRRAKRTAAASTG